MAINYSQFPFAPMPQNPIPSLLTNPAQTAMQQRNSTGLLNLDPMQVQQARMRKGVADAEALNKRQMRGNMFMALGDAFAGRDMNANFLARQQHLQAQKAAEEKRKQGLALGESAYDYILKTTGNADMAMLAKNNPAIATEVMKNRFASPKDRKIILQNGIQYYADTGQPVLRGAPAKENNPSTLIENATYIKGLRDDLRNTTDPDQKAIIQQQIDDFAGLGGAYKYTPKVAFDMQQSKTAATQGLVFGERPMNKGEISTDEKFATIYTKYIDDGRGAKNVANLERLTDAEEILKTAAKNGVAISGVTAGMLSNSPRLQAYFNEQGVMTEERVASVIQQSLKEILGGNFAEKEGEALIRRGYNAALSPEENLERLLDLKSQVQQLIETEQDSVDYFENNNKSLRGYKGKTYTEESFIRDLSKDYKSDAVELSNDELKQAYRDAPENSLWEKSLEKELERRSRLGK